MLAVWGSTQGQPAGIPLISVSVAGLPPSKMIACQNGKLTFQLCQLVIAPQAMRCIEIVHFSDRHFWHAGYDKANLHRLYGFG